MSAERFAQATEEFIKAIDLDPLLSLAHYQLGQASMNLQRYASAIKAYKDCIEAERQLFTLKQTNRFEVEKQKDDEIRELKNLLDSGKGRAPTMMGLEQRLRDLENQRHQTGGTFQPPAQALVALGSAYFRNGDRDAAEAQWRAAIEANPKLGEAHNNIAVIYMQTGRFEEALQELTLAEKAGFKVNPQFKADLKERAKTKTR
jgi:tetratricopeptide (TPR) repeat protein